MKALSFMSARPDVHGLCLIAALAVGCSFDSSQLRALPSTGGSPGAGGGSGAGGATSGGGTATGGSPTGETSPGGTSTGGGISTTPASGAGSIVGTGGASGAGGVGLSGGQTGGGGTGGQATTAASTTPASCVPGASALCYCPTGQQGAQICTSAGTFGACVCASPTVDAGGAGGSDGAATRPPDAPTATGGTTYTPTGGTISYPTGGTISHPTGGTISYPTGGIVTPTGGTVTSTGGTPSSTPTGTTVTFASGKAQGAMTGLGWVALGMEDSITDPTCGGAVITSTSNCTDTTWNSTTALCITGSTVALSAVNPDYTDNWGVAIGVNSTAPAGSGLGQSFTSITITVTGSPTTGLSAVIHRKSDPEGTNYYAALTSGTAIILTDFKTEPENNTPVALTTDDVPNIDEIGVQVTSTTTPITVTNLCITGIRFTQ